MLKLQRFDSFNSWLFLVYWYAHYLVEQGGTFHSFSFFFFVLNLSFIIPPEKKKSTSLNEEPDTVLEERSHFWQCGDKDLSENVL